MIPEQVRQSLIERVKPDAKHAADCYDQINRSVEIANTIEQTRSKLALDKDLSDAGRNKKMREAVKRAAVGIYDATKSYRSTMSRVVGERKTFVPKVPDRTDAVGELRRQEMRTFFRTMKPADRQMAVVDPDLGDVALEAILDASPALSGLNGNSKHHYEELKKTYAERHYGNQAKYLDELEADYGNVGAVFGIAVQELKKAVPMADVEFEQLLETARKAVDERYSS